ncbi:hypothetical protein J8273_8392 [Carpediemonas membranifera]|uniref:Uncharacterized protein n=1 Tax=Carpediemonas membranifera TaxID=201153 RepID=A0A8J6AW50_9EUKA|nr:hypothetical protein J8273_8392 [Carpediemonas membranifera]|eukprot:KAG9389718.1 hypothetical protein J8273_8392 [Carpediemonas membranifera]
MSFIAAVKGQEVPQVESPEHALLMLLLDLLLPTGLGSIIIGYMSGHKETVIIGFLSLLTVVPWPLVGIILIPIAIPLFILNMLWAIIPFLGALITMFLNFLLIGLIMLLIFGGMAFFFVGFIGGKIYAIYRGIMTFQAANDAAENGQAEKPVDNPLTMPGAASAPPPDSGFQAAY